MRRFFLPGFAPVYIAAGASFAGAMLAAQPPEFVFAVLQNQWTPQYVLLATFMHGGLWHALLNAAGLFFIGGQLLLPLLGARRWWILFALGAIAGHLANNIFGGAPAIGISAAVLAMLGCALHPFGRLPVKLLLIHDILRLPPFRLSSVAGFIVALDVAGILFGWGFFAHWAHLAGFASGWLYGRFRFHYRR